MNQQEKEAFVKELLNNLPEYAVSFDCLGWNYDKCLFKLSDKEDGKKYLLTLPLAVEGFDKLCHEIDGGRMHFVGLGPDYKQDGGQWDALSVDALLQMSVLGEVIYG